MKRITLRLPDPAMSALEDRATESGEATASLAARLLRTALQQDPPPRPPRARTLTASPAPLGEQSPQRPPWINPGSDPAWCKDVWCAIVALLERYPRALRRLEGDWWEHCERVETLAALATWRARIDAAGQDPREELAFQAALDHLAAQLNQTPGSKPRFQLDTPPPSTWSNNTT